MCSGSLRLPRRFALCFFVLWPREVGTASGTLSNDAADKKVLRIWFTDMWTDFSLEHNFFMFLLENAGTRSTPPFVVKLDDERPDVLISGMMGKDYVDYPSTPIVFFTGENKRPVYGPNSFLNVGFDFRPKDIGYVRLPLWIWNVDWFDGGRERLMVIRSPQIIAPVSALLEPVPKKVLRKKKKFCAFVVSNCGCYARNRAFKLINSYRRVDSPGSCYKNMYTTIKKGDKGKLAFLHSYRFIMAYENTQSPGYVTEKLLHAKLSGAVPIYWGAPWFGYDFDPDGVIDANGLSSTQLMKKIEQLDKDKGKWYEVASTPPMDMARLENVLRAMDIFALRVLRRVFGTHVRLKKLKVKLPANSSADLMTRKARRPMPRLEDIIAAEEAEEESTKLYSGRRRVYRTPAWNLREASRKKALEPNVALIAMIGCICLIALFVVKLLMVSKRHQQLAENADTDSSRSATAEGKDVD